MFSPEYRLLLIRDLVDSGIQDTSSLFTWQWINSCITVLICVLPTIMAAGMFLCRRGRQIRGIGILTTAAQWLLWIMYALGCGAVLLFLFRFVRFLILNAASPQGVVAIYSMVISEGLMAVIAVFLFVLLHRFLNSCIDSGTSIAYTLATGKLDNRSIPALTATGFGILGILEIFLALNRLFTVTAVINVVRSYYKITVADHPGLWSEAICLVMGSIGNFLLARYLKQYKKTTEQAIFAARSS